MMHILNNYTNTAKVLEDCLLQRIHLGSLLSQMMQPCLEIPQEHPFGIVSTTVLGLRPKVK